jgi:site-specific recombinase XerD
MTPIEFGIILAAPTTWSITIMTDNPKTCVDPYLDSFGQSFAAANYTAGTIRTYRHLARKLGRLMGTAGIAPSALTPDLADQLARTAARGADSMIRFHHFARRFAEHLIDIGVVQPVPLTEAQIARAALLTDYEAYLIKQRGLSPRSIYHVLRFADRFLDHRFGTGIIDLTRLRTADTISFVQHVLAGRRPYRDKTVTTHLRTFFQYLFARGATATNLALSIPKAAQRWAARLPRHLSPDGVEAVLASVRCNPRHGARDYVMLLLMARLGLRAPEVIAIQLDDVDWRAGELLVRGKGKLHDRLPISTEVGEALSRYLREERGPTSCRTVFVTHRAPHRAFKDGQIVNTILKDALAATGQKPVTPYVGSHLLRHSLATQLVNTGASLDEVSDVLRHRSRSSTMVYARLDIDGLRSIAQPWPVAGGVQ